MIKPTIVCPKCHAAVVLASLVDATTCPTCGAFEPTDVDFRWRALGRATETLLVRRAHVAPEAALATCRVDGASAIELRPNRVSPENLGELVDASVGSAIGALVPFMLEAARLHEVGGLVALHVAPDAARRLAEGTAKWMTSDGETLATIVNLKGRAIAQARWAPAAVSAFGAAAAWQILSIAVAQKHLHDINARLDRIERRVDEILKELDQQVQDELRGDATALGLIARAVTTKPPGEKARGVHQLNVRSHLDRTRRRHENLFRRAKEQGDAWRPDTAKWFGQSLDSAGAKGTDRVREFHRRLMAVYGNVLVEVVAVRLLLALGEDEGFIDAALERARQNLDAADALGRAFDANLAAALPAMSGVIVGQRKAAAVRSGVAFAHWEEVERQLSAVTPLRRMLDDFDAPQLCAVIGSAGEVKELRLLVSSEAAA